MVEDETLHVDDEIADIVHNVQINKEEIGASCCLCHGVTFNLSDYL